MKTATAETLAVPGGNYRHFKGTLVHVIAIAVHSETGEPLVVYKASNGAIFARPRGMFEDGRFQRMSDPV